MKTAAVVCALLVVGAAPAAAAGRPRTGDVQRALEALAATPGVVGVIGEVYADGKRVGHGSAGSRLLGGKGGAIPSGARYRVASQSKQMVATVVQQLFAEGKLRRDDKLSDLLPVVAERDLVERAAEITVEQLLRHTAGVPDGMDAFDVFDFTTNYSAVDLLKASRSLPRQGEPGQFAYSTTHYILLGMIIERVTGSSLAAELSRRIFEPLGMTDTYLPTRPPQGIRGPHGHGYAPDSNGVARDVDRLNPSTYGVQGVVSTARDVSAFQRAYVQGKLGGGSAPPPPPGPCGDKLPLLTSAGSFPGSNSATVTTPDGRLQLALSVTLSGDHQDPAIGTAIGRATQAILCPSK